MSRHESPSVWEPREPPAGSPAFVYRAELFDGRCYLDRLRVHHLELARRFLEAGGGLYTIDVVTVAATSRSYSLVEGFINAFDTWNPFVAAPLLRLQLDTLVRIAYMAQAPNADQVAEHVIGGGEFRRLKDAGGRPLRDRLLLEHARVAHPWLEEVYEATSGWVHFSPDHLRATWQMKPSGDPEASPDDLGIFGAVPLRAEQIPLVDLRALLGAMTKATEELFGYIEVWESRKGLPPGQERQLGP